MYAARAAIGSDPGIIVTITFLKVSFMLTIGAARDFRYNAHSGTSVTRWKLPKGSYPDRDAARYGRELPEETPLVKLGDSSRYGPLTQAVIRHPVSYTHLTLPTIYSV